MNFSWLSGRKEIKPSGVKQKKTKNSTTWIMSTFFWNKTQPLRSVSFISQKSNASCPIKRETWRGSACFHNQSECEQTEYEANPSITSEAILVKEGILIFHGKFKFHLCTMRKHPRSFRLSKLKIKIFFFFELRKLPQRFSMQHILK